MGTVAYKLMVDWDFDGTYTDETAYLVRATGSWAFVPQESAFNGSSGIVPTCTFVLTNKTGRFSTLNTGGALYSDIADGGAYQAPMYFQVNVDGGGLVTIFSGHIKLPAEISKADGQFPVVTIECRGIEDLYLQRRLKTTQSDFYSWYTDGKTESEIIESWLTELGLTSSNWSLDTGMFIIPFAILDDTSIIEACWNIAAACGGRFYSTPDGKFRYENMFHWCLSPHNTSQETFTTATYEGLIPRYNDKDLFSDIIVAAHTGYLNVEDEIYTQSKVIVIEPGQTKTLTAKISSPIYSIASITYDAITSGGKDISADITLTATYYAKKVELEFENANTTKAAEIHNTTITGVTITINDDEQVEVSSAASFWSSREGRTRRITANEYINTIDHAQMIADFLLDRNQIPRLLWTVQNAKGKTSRLLGDRVTINDASVMSSSRAAIIIGIDWSADHNGFTQNLSLFDLEGYYDYLDTDPGYFIIGTNKLGSSGSDIGRLFY